MLPLIITLSLISILLCCLGVHAYYIFNKNNILLSRVPTPKFLPILGNVYDICDNEAGIFKKLRKLSTELYPIYGLWSSVLFPAINIVSPEDMQIILSNVKHNEKSDIYLLFNEWLGEGLLTSTGELWQQRRKLLTPSFHFKILKTFVPIFNEHATIFANKIKQNSADIDVMEEISTCSLHMITETAMGTKFDEKESEEKYRSSIKKMGQYITHRILRPWYYTRLTYLFCPNFYYERFVLRYLKSFTNKVIKERERTFDANCIKNMDETDENGIKKRKFAMLDILIASKLRNEIGLEGVREEVDTFMFEGHDTISKAMSFCFMLLACNRKIQDKVYDELVHIFGDSDRKPTYEDFQEMSYMEMVIKESLRLYPSVPLISRVLGEDMVSHSGYLLPKGTIVILHIFDTHRIPEHFPDPEKFDPDRFLPENIKNRHPYAYLPFSAGSRNCIGQKFAMIEMKSIIAETLRNVVLLPVDTPDTITMVCDIIMKAKDKIKIKVQKREKGY